MNTTRRDFLRQTSVTAATAIALRSITLTSSTATADEPSLMPIIDTHQHLWDLAKFKLPWLGGVPPILQRSYVTRDYLRAVEGLNVVKAVYMEVDLHPSQQHAEAEYLIELCRSGQSPTVAAVISGRPNSENFAAYISAYKGNSYIKGIRQVLHSPEAKRGLCLEPQFVKSMNLLGELNMSFDLCMRPGELSDAVKLVDQCRRTRFIVDHCGNADPKAFLPDAARNNERPSHNVEAWKKDMSALAQRSNVICKISGIIASAPKTDDVAGALAPIVNFCLDTFGPERVIFGGDWPVCLLGGTFRQWVEALRAIIVNRSVQHQRELLHDNAARFYNL